MVIVVEAVHPLLFCVPITVYVVVFGGVATTTSPFGSLKLSHVLGSHVYVFAPDIVKVTLLPKQIDGLAGLAEMLGEITETFTLSDAVHPPVVTVTI